MNPVRIGLLGCGNVGAAFYDLVQNHHEEIAARTGVELQIVKVAVRSISSPRLVEVDQSLLTTDSASVVTDPNVDLVVEVIGGIEPARELTLAAFAAGKAVVNANKELLANCGAELFDAADDAGVDMLFEAAVAGAIPIIRPLRESLVGERISRVMGIVNGTTNYILTKMSADGTSYVDALAEAQSLGYAERDPTADVEGFDAGAKAAIIASIAFGVRVVAGDVYHEGIAEVSSTDIMFADRLGYVVKLLAIVERFDTGNGIEVSARVHPTMVPKAHPLASVHDSFNAVFIEGEAAGELMFYGRGAGGHPTASAILGDVIDAASNRKQGSAASVGRLGRAHIRPIDELESEFFINLNVADEPGVLADVAATFGRHNVSIRAVEQEGLGEDARLILITHRANEANIQSTLAELRGMAPVHAIDSVMRVIGED